MGYIKKWIKSVLVCLLIGILITSTLTLTSCSPKVKAAETAKDFHKNQMGNITNEGLATKTDQWVFFQFKDGFYKMRLDGSRKERVSEGGLSYINVWNGCLYYTNDYPENGEIYKMAIDGTGITKLNNERSYYPIVKDGWIYYSTVEYFAVEEVEFKIKKMKLDGTSQTEIISETIKGKGLKPNGYFFLFDGWIYYKDALKMNKLYKIQDDGKNKTKVSDTIFSNEFSDGKFEIGKNGIYYIQPNEDDKLYLMKLDGTEEKLVINKSVADINVTDEYIFYTSRSEKYKLYRRDINSKAEKRLADYSVSNINIVGDWIYCTDFYSEGEFYAIKGDGSGRAGIKLP